MQVIPLLLGRVEITGIKHLRNVQGEIVFSGYTGRKSSFSLVNICVLQHSLYTLFFIHLYGWQDSNQKLSNSDIIVYVLGGPGSGKGTQCSKIVQHLGFTHLSAGDLLQTEVNSGSQTGKMIQEFKKEGKLVPSEVIVKLLQQAMQQSGNRKFLIDGFPRNEENRLAAEKMVLNFFACFLYAGEFCTEIREGVDDNIDTIKKRLKVYHESTLPVIDHFAKKGKVRKINAERPVEEVFRSVEAVFFELGLVKHGVETSNVQTV
ncbi:UMP-CMP kinase 3 [Bienertia sinuspersici]